MSASGSFAVGPLLSAFDAKLPVSFVSRIGVKRMSDIGLEAVICGAAYPMPSIRQIPVEAAFCHYMC